MSDKYQPIIGLEIHVQLKTRSKMFCSSPNSVLDVPPNTHICEVCTGQPGSLPVPNEEAIRKAALVGLALGCSIAEHSKFDRKNYFYPDLPKGYQISQYDEPIAAKGEFKYVVGGQDKIVRIRRAHLEEDTGKLLHDGKVSLVDYNRAGVPLLEIVTEPDFRSAQEVREFMQLLRNTVRYLDVSDGDMEKGHLRGEPNISVRPVGQNELPGYKVELKNINSFKNVFDSLNYEIQRQCQALADGEILGNETRGWNGKKTIVQRTKEEAHDYRYFPEPDLPILHFSPEVIASLREAIPELPHEKERRFILEFKLPEKDAAVLINDKNLAEFFEEAVSELQEWVKEQGVIATPTESRGKQSRGQEIAAVPSGPHNDSMAKLAKLVSNWITGEFQALLKAANLTPKETKITAENFAELIKMVDRGEVSSTAGKQILGLMFASGGDPSNIAQEKGLGQVSDEAALSGAVDEVIKANPDAVKDYQSGKQQAIGFLVGQVVSKMRGQANPQTVTKLLQEKLT